jgi:signal transduction histidine kinase/HPt (histidine-containing phosphotransfer) domain-containing protein
MTGPDATQPMLENDAAPETQRDADILSDRVDILYRFGRIHLFLPFSALCIAGVLYIQIVPIWIAIVPLLLQIAATVFTGQLAEAYRRRDPTGSPLMWARRFTFASALSGAAWGIGAIIWFSPDFFPAQAFLTLAMLGMTATEFIARCSYRPAYLAHAALSLGPLALMLLLAGNVYASMTSLLVLFFGGVLYSYCEGIAGLLDEGLRLRRENADLVTLLSREKSDAEIARDLAEASTRAKSAFVANISHEIRTPLNALLGMAQLLERSELDRAQKSHVKVLLEAGRGLKTLLDDVIALSRDEGEDRHVADEDCDAAQTARTVARLLQPRAWEKQLRLGVSAGANLPRVAADPRRVRQVLLKLADNAIKFTPRGAIEIRVEAEIRDDGGQRLRFSVIDTGLGIPSEMAANVFEPFSPGDNSYTRRNDGAGLGLAVAKRVIETLGGEIGFESEPGQGSTFWFTVPAIGADQTLQDETAANASDASPPWGLALLVRIADETMRKQIANMLEPFGNRLVFADSAAEAIGLAGRETFDAIIVGASDADSIAAAPGVKAPLLALALSGMRTPAAAGEMLRWPAPAGALYAGLRDLLGRGADSSGMRPDPAQQATAAIDAPAFAALEKSLGLRTLIEILQSYMTTAEELCRKLDQASVDENWDDAARIAQDIAGAAGGLGLAALTTAARGFTQRAREGDTGADLHDAAKSIAAEHARVSRALANLYPELAA